MEHSEDSKGDLRFLIPPEAKQPMDVPITLVYCNQRSTAEDSAVPKIGQKSMAFRQVVLLSIMH
jgi:hypothetical protein